MRRRIGWIAATVALAVLATAPGASAASDGYDARTVIVKYADGASASQRSLAGHGSHVAGTAAARANNGRGIAGVAFNSPLAICKALDRTSAGAIAGIANCIAYLTGAGAKVISLSLGTTDGSTMLRNAVAAASRSALVVAAAGNSGASTTEYPAGYPEAVSVAATDRRDRHAPLSTANAKAFDELGPAGRDPQFGYGRVNLVNAATG